MDQRDLYVKAIRYQKTGIELYFNLVATMQQGGQSIMAEALEYATWLPQGSKKTCISLLDQLSGNTKVVKNAVAHGYTGMERILSPVLVTPVKKGASVTAPKNDEKSEPEVIEPLESTTLEAESKVAQTNSAVASKRTAGIKRAAPKKSATRAKTAAGKETSASEETTGPETGSGKVDAAQPEVETGELQPAALLEDSLNGKELVAVEADGSERDEHSKDS